MNRVSLLAQIMRVWAIVIVNKGFGGIPTYFWTWALDVLSKIVIPLEIPQDIS